MARIFVSHSSRDSQLVKNFTRLLEVGAGVRGDTIFASSVEGKDIQLGKVNEVIKDELKSASLAIFVLSRNFFQSPYCMAEMGAAWATDTRVFVLTAPPLGKDDVTAVFDDLHVEHLAARRSLNKLADVVKKSGLNAFDPGVAAWDAQRDEFTDWLASSYEERPIARVVPQSQNGDEGARIEDLPKWRDRGHWSESIVDGTLYIGSSYMVMDVKREIAGFMEQGRVLPTVYAYMTNNGYHNWLRLSGDPTYKYHGDGMELFTKFSKPFADQIRSEAGRDDLDLISLGPGDGKKDILLLNALADATDLLDLYYYPFDINSSMVSAAMSRIGPEPHLTKLKVKAILADFESLPAFSKIYQYREAPNVLSLLGNTLGNLPSDRSFLGQIYRSAMNDGDILLLEVRKSQSGKSVLKTDANMRFDFGPLELLGVEFDPRKLHYNVEEGRSLVPGTKTTVATYEEVVYGGKKFKDVQLSLIHEYDPEQLREACEAIGFSVLDDPGHESSAALLLQK